jgi:hypothetical protein
LQQSQYLKFESSAIIEEGDYIFIQGRKTLYLSNDGFLEIENNLQNEEEIASSQSNKLELIRSQLLLIENDDNSYESSAEIIIFTVKEIKIQKRSNGTLEIVASDKSTKNAFILRNNQKYYIDNYIQQLQEGDKIYIEGRKPLLFTNGRLEVSKSEDVFQNDGSFDNLQTGERTLEKKEFDKFQEVYVERKHGRTEKDRYLERGWIFRGYNRENGKHILQKGLSFLEVDQSDIWSIDAIEGGLSDEGLSANALAKKRMFDRLRDSATLSEEDYENYFSPTLYSKLSNVGNCYLISSFTAMKASPDFVNLIRTSIRRSSQPGVIAKNTFSNKSLGINDEESNIIREKLKEKGILDENYRVIKSHEELNDHNLDLGLSDQSQELREYIIVKLKEPLYFEVGFPLGNPTEWHKVILHRHLQPQKNPEYGEKDHKGEIDTREELYPVDASLGFQVLEAAYILMKNDGILDRTTIEGGFGHRALLDIFGRDDYQKFKISSQHRESGSEYFRSASELYSNSDSFTNGTPEAIERLDEWLINYSNNRFFTILNSVSKNRSSSIPNFSQYEKRRGEAQGYVRERLREKGFLDENYRVRKDIDLSKYYYYEELGLKDSFSSVSSEILETLRIYQNDEYQSYGNTFSHNHAYALLEVDMNYRETIEEVDFYGMAVKTGRSSSSIREHLKEIGILDDDYKSNYTFSELREMPLDNINMTEEEREMIREILINNSGRILVTNPHKEWDIMSLNYRQFKDAFSQVSAVEVK